VVVAFGAVVRPGQANAPNHMLLDCDFLTIYM
jgi:hypothetical protein